MRQCVLHTANPWTAPPYPANWQLKWKTGITFSHCWNLFRLSLQQHVHPSASPTCPPNLHNDKPVVPGGIIAAWQPRVSLLEVVRMWLRQWDDLRIALNTARPTDCENTGNETLSSYLFVHLVITKNKVWWVGGCNSCTKHRFIHTMKSKQTCRVKCFFFWHLRQFLFLCISTFAKSNLAYQFTLQVPKTFSFYFLMM